MSETQELSVEAYCDGYNWRCDVRMTHYGGVHTLANGDPGYPDDWEFETVGDLEREDDDGEWAVVPWKDAPDGLDDKLFDAAMEAWE